MFIETMEQVLPEAQTYVVEPGSDGAHLNLQPVEQQPGTPAEKDQP